MRILGNMLVMLALAGCASTMPEAELAQVTGEALYRERIAAPPGARLEVILEDISIADAPAVRLGKLVKEDAGQPPYAFSIDYDPAEIDPRHTYRVAARLYAGEDLLFVSDQVHQVITQGFSSTASVRMRRVAQVPSRPFGAVPAAFAGTLPSAGPGIDTQLHLLDDGVYFLREAYQDREDAVFDDIGRYLISSDRKQLSLHGGREAPLRFSISGPDTLRRLDHDGQHIASDLDYTLERQPGLALPEPRLLMAGKYRYLAGAGRYRECLTGLDMPVAAEEDNRVLEEAYLAARKQPGEALRVNLEGRIEQRAPVEGSGPVLTLVPERFIGVWPDQDCPVQVSAATLQNTYWRVIFLGNSAARRFENQREPHLIFSESGELAGSDGCNRLSGRYQSDADGNIVFQGIAATSRMCVHGMEQASALSHALAVARFVRIIGQHLEVLDTEGNLLMRLEAVALY